MEHPITPPPELVQQWRQKWTEGHGEFGVYLATLAARWAADQELEACLEWLFKHQYDIAVVSLRAARRPKPPSLKEQALRILVENGTTLDGRVELDRDDIAIINRALEALTDD